MGSNKLKADLTNCLINFDRRVVMTELLDEYKMAYSEVDEIVKAFVEEQEKKDKHKFVKSYLVHGLQEEKNKEVLTIVEEAKLKDWLKKLQNAESSLYSVEIAGGAKAAAAVFKPMKVLECKQTHSRRAGKTPPVASGETETATTTAAAKKQIKEESPKEVTKPQPVKTTPKKQNPVKKTSPKTEISPNEQKPGDKKATAKKGINNFFAPSTATTKKSEDIKPKAGVIKPPTPKKMKDFFKKQTEKPVTKIETSKTPDKNMSVQLFDDNEEDPEEVLESSDEEEKLEALKRDIISSDVEMEEENENTEISTTKRRRILDSDDEEDDPPIKQEKLDLKEETQEEVEAVAETYLDEEGFVITKKPKQKTTASSSKSSATKKTPPVTLKTSPKESKKTATKETKTTVNPATKTKQAGIMNFFSKK